MDKAISKPRLTYISIHGFKSIKDMPPFSPRAVNIFIGPNGAGKSNFITFFSFLSWMLHSGGRLQERITYLGGASDILHDGPDITQELSGSIGIETKVGINEYRFKLRFAKPDRLMFAEEEYRYSKHDMAEEATWTPCGRGHEEARLPEANNLTATTILNLMRGLVVYQFHNTSDTAAMRLSWNADDRWLKEYGQNLGAFLFYMMQHERVYYERIVKYIGLVLPFFSDFALYEEFGKVMLRWRERGTSKVFNAGQASDGMLRLIALISLLAQPPKDLPAVLFLDEPELGLHPAAIDVVSGLIKAAATRCQIFIATQSVSLVNNFELENIVVINRPGRDSEYVKPDAEALQGYMEEYSVGEIWEKNIIGGRPA